MHMFCLEIFSWNILHCFHSHIQNLTCRFFQLPTSILLRLNIFLQPTAGCPPCQTLRPASAHVAVPVRRSQSKSDARGRLSRPQVSADTTPSLNKVRYRAVQEVSRLEHTDVFGINSNRLIQIEVRWVSLYVAHVEVFNHLVHAKRHRGQLQ